jgi:hypothetical protein
MFEFKLSNQQTIKMTIPEIQRSTIRETFGSGQDPSLEFIASLLAIDADDNQPSRYSYKTVEPELQKLAKYIRSFLHRGNPAMRDLQVV